MTKFWEDLVCSLADFLHHKIPYSYDLTGPQDKIYKTKPHMRLHHILSDPAIFQHSTLPSQEKFGSVPS